MESKLPGYLNHKMAVTLLSEKHGYSKKEIARFLDWFFGDYAKMGLKELCRFQEIITIKGLGRFYPTPKGIAAKNRRRVAFRIVDNREARNYRETKKKRKL